MQRVNKVIYNHNKRKQKYKTPLLSEVMKNYLFKIIYIFKLVCNYTDRMIIIPILEEKH